MGRNKMTEGPDEMVKIFVDPSAPGAEGEELPFRMAVVGDFTGRVEDQPLQDESRKPKEVNKKNFNKVMASMNVETQFTVPNRMGAKEGVEIPVDLKFKSIKDFHPDRVADQVPQLKKLIELRQQLKDLKQLGPFKRPQWNLLQKMMDQFEAELKSK